MVILQAPYPMIEVTTFLPNPEFQDKISLNVSINKKRALDGTLYSYVKDSGFKKLEWTFNLAIFKAIEVRQFYELYSASKLKITDWNNTIFYGYFVIDAIDLRFVSRGEYCDIQLVFSVE